MGIHGFHDTLKGATNQINLASLKGQTGGVDISGWLYKGGHSTQYVIDGVNTLIDHGILPVIIFDGVHPPAKNEVVEHRKTQRLKYLYKAAVCEAERDLEKAQMYHRLAVGRTADHIRSIKKFCEEQRVPYVQSPFEADAECALLDKTGKVDFIISDDGDLALFGCRKVLFKINLEKGTGEMYDQSLFKDCWGAPYDKDCLVACLAITGCDYFKGGVPNYGMAKAKIIYKELAQPFDFDQFNDLLAGLNPNFRLEGQLLVSFAVAFCTFKFQTVYDPEAKTKVGPLEPYPDGLSYENFPFAGIPNNSDVGHYIPIEKPIKSKPVTSPAAQRPKYFGSITMLNKKRPNYHYCRYCTDAFRTLKEKKDHESEKHPLICKECNQKFKFPNLLEDHMHSHGRDPFLCEFCGEVYWTPSLLVNHYKNVHDPSKRNLPCPNEWCQRVISHKKELARHLKICKKPADQCNECGKSDFKSETALKRHMVKKHGLLYCTEDGCGQMRQFEHLSVLEEHLKICHGHAKVIKGRVNCAHDKCQIRFPSNEAMMEHLVSAHGYTPLDMKRPYRCTKCPKRYKNINHLTAHKKTHATKEDLKKLQEAKLAAKKFVCHVPGCVKRYETNRYYVIHMREAHQIKIVDPRKPFSCTIEGCYRSFTDSQGRNRHLKGFHGIDLPNQRRHPKHMREKLAKEQKEKVMKTRK